jgi:L-lactate dehydrogenase complex protein LldG
MSSREQILNQLRATPPPFADHAAITTRREMVPPGDPQPEALRARFVEEAQKLSCDVTICADAAQAIECLLTLVGTDRRLLSWDLAHIPLPGLADALDRTGIEIAAATDAMVRVGLTGVDAALASTGSVILSSGPGRERTVSLLPDLHIVALTTDQIIPNLETWGTAQRAQNTADFRQLSSTVIISGPSRTADIAMQLVLGAHGPAALHILIVR